MGSKVDHSHFYPRCWLAGFADSGMIGMRLVGEATSKVISVSNAGVRKKMYSRARPDGTRIDDFEPILGHVENAAAPVLKAFDSIWPLTQESKLALAQLFAMQLVRGPRRMEWYERMTRSAMAEARLPGSPWAGKNLDATEAHLLEDTQRLVSMVEQHYMMTSAFCSMHWTRLDFARPMLVSSDHPVVVWLLGERARQPAPTPLNAGVLQAIEVRIPVSSTRALLLTWSDERDQDCWVLKGRDHHAANLNAFTIANAHKQWFHIPNSHPRVGCGPLLPLAPEELSSYDQAAAIASIRRREAQRIVLPQMGKRTLQRERQIEVVSIT